jgi:hypothetical protein
MWCDNKRYNKTVRIFRAKIRPLVDQFSEKKGSQNLPIFTSFRLVVMRFLAQIFGRPFWGSARGFLAVGDFWWPWGFLAVEGFWRGSENFSHPWQIW